MLYGDPSLSKRVVEQKEALSTRDGTIILKMWRNRSNPSSNNKMLYKTASNEFEITIKSLQNWMKA